MTLEKFNTLGTGTDLINTQTQTRFVKTDKTTITWYSRDGKYYQNYSILENSNLPVIRLSLIELAH